MLLFFLKGSLSAGICDKEDTRDERHKNTFSKNTYFTQKIIKGYQVNFTNICVIVKQEYKEKPNYKYLLNLFQNLYISKNYDKDKNTE